jgi:hypothetical protein
VPIPSAEVEDAVLLLGALALSVGLVDLPPRFMLRRRDRPRPSSKRAERWPGWARHGALVLAGCLAGAATLGAVAGLLDRGSAGPWVALGFLAGSLPALGVGLAGDLVHDTAVTQVGEAELAGLTGRAFAQASAGGRAAAALSGGSAVSLLLLLFVESDISPLAIVAFMAGAAAAPALGSLARARPRVRLSARATTGRAPDGPVGRPNELAVGSPTGRAAQRSFGLVALTMGASTLIIQSAPLSWFLISDALLIPLLVGALGTWVAIVAATVTASIGRSSAGEPLRWGLWGSVVASLLGVTAAATWVGGPESQLWAPLAVGAILLQSVSAWAVARSPRAEGRASAAAVPLRRPGDGVPWVRGALLAPLVLGVIVLLGLVGAYAIAGRPPGSSFGFDPQIGWVGVGLAGAALGCWAPSSSWLASAEAIRAGARPGADEGRFSGALSSEPSERAPTRWAPRLAQGYDAVASATAGVLAMLALVAIAPFREGISPSVLLPRIAPTDPELWVGLLIGAIAAIAFANPALGELGGRMGRLLVVGDALLVAGLLLGPVGLTGVSVGAVAAAFALGVPGIAAPVVRTTATEAGSADPTAAGPSVLGMARRDPGGGRAELLATLARALPVGALLMATLLVTQVTIGFG